MKEKIKIILLILIFLIMLVVIKMLLNYESNSRLKTEIAKKNVTITEENLVLEEINSQIEEENMENNVLEVTEENFEKEVLNESKKVLVDFYAQWCGPCQVLSPIVEEVAKSNPDIKVVRVNIDDAESLAIDYGVMSIPTLVVIEAGKEVNRSVGLISQNEIEDLIK